MKGSRTSSIDCRLVRLGHELWLIDPTSADSQDGAFVRGHRVSSYLLLPADMFEVGSTTFLAMSEAMRHARRVLADVLGRTLHSAVDRALLTRDTTAP